MSAVRRGNDKRRRRREAIALEKASPADYHAIQRALGKRCDKQLGHLRETYHRVSCGISMFKIQDPDPCAVDGGRVTGVRIEAFEDVKFLTPYYIFLNQPVPWSPSLRIHKHTVPPCIPLAAITSKWLPQPASVREVADRVKPAPVQNLVSFVYAVRNAISAHHLRQEALARVKKALALEGKPGQPYKYGLTAVRFLDVEGREIRFAWQDGKLGLAAVGAGGALLKCVICDGNGRRPDLERTLCSQKLSIESLPERLRAVHERESRMS
ncbi:MAG: hypothetical protein M1825_003782 [Sarcosagium campestre]|nr:MAG: hypothetical protein M1825_003782 [Sarcosagium campestre]